MFLIFSIVVSVLVYGFYFMRKRIARWVYVYRTGNKNPDWEALERKWWGEDGDSGEKLEFETNAESKSKS